MHILDVMKQKDKLMHKKYQKSGLSARREQRKKEPSISSSSSSPSEKEDS